MAQDYVVLNETDEMGVVAMNKAVFKSIAEISINEIENAVRIPETTFTKPLSVKIEENKLHITAFIKLKYGANVKATCELVQNKIYENIEFMTGFKAADVTVNVVDFEI